MDLKQKLISHFRTAPSSPFLFVGSGFSQRYLGLQDWEGLLRRFSEGLRPFEYYFSTADEDLSLVASLMADDFHNLWWTSPAYEVSREKHKAKAKDRTSALRIEICAYLNSISLTDLMALKHKEEIEILSRLNVDGVITTNWDLLLEKLFPDYKIFIGQSELLFSNPQSIAEIYKIHGSASRPASLVLTKEDYTEFDNKNPYLAAKLITLFVEHPIVFIGYSLTDPNIRGLLKSIVSVLGEDKLEKLQNNLVFVQREKNNESEYSQTYMTIDEGQIPITIIRTESYVPVYEALDEVKRRIPARVLRYCKEQLYELVKSSTPEAKLFVADIDDLDNKKDIEFVVGVGVASVLASQLGYQGISLLDLFEDGLIEDQKFDARKLLETSIPSIGRGATYVPIFKYLKACGIDSAEKYKASKFQVDRHVLPDLTSYITKQYAKAFVRTEKNKNAEEIIETNPPEKAAIFLAFLPKDKFNFPLVNRFLLDNLRNFDSTSSYSTYFRKLACLFDRLYYGWD
ncbi:SIR2 family protein [Nitrosospira sp. NRS527]|uniref:SIR2 family protein n=1 Tax=Nitrosospira sp. NRS527 TaxID=155925 RepID=UPI001AF8FA7D|nr:SIR2 family protein [Nitrosospira sp. NRS527]BCT67098.1 hypothetical protein NNRS527_00676 [Nitrosospira sp. NRS527]